MEYGNCFYEKDVPQFLVIMEDFLKHCEYPPHTLQKPIIWLELYRKWMFHADAEHQHGEKRD
jgi:hypothetical protein